MLLALSALIAACTPQTPAPTAVSLPTASLPTSAPSPTILAETIIPTEPAPPTQTLAPPPSVQGVRAVYVKEGQLWIWDSGRASPITENLPVYSPRLSADGQLAVFLQQVDAFHLELWVAGLEAAPRRLVSVADLDQIGADVRLSGALAINPLQFAWVGQSHTIAFNSQQVFNGPIPAPLDDLNQVNADSGVLQFTLLAGWGGAFAFSPDGARVAISTPTQIVLADANGGNYRLALTYDAVQTYTQARYYAQPRWYSDSSALLVVIPPVDALAETPQASEMWRIPLQGAPELLGQVYAVPDFDTPIALAPDLSFLLYLTETGEPNQILRTLHMAGLDGSGVVALVSGVQLRFYGWAGENGNFFYGQGETQELFMAGPGTTSQALRPGVEGLLEPRWLGNGCYTVVQQFPDGFELQLARLGGGLVVIDRFTSYPAYDIWAENPCQ